MISALLSIWWLWIAIALALAIVELFSPGFLFLGFALGALATSAVVGFGWVASGSVLLAVFAGISLLAWIALRFAFRKQSSGAKIITRDINDN